MKGLALTETELPHAVVKQRRATVSLVHLSLLDLRDVRNDARLRPVAIRKQCREPDTKLLIRNTPQIPENPSFHRETITCTFSSAQKPRRRANATRIRLGIARALHSLAPDKVRSQNPSSCQHDDVAPQELIANRQNAPSRLSN